MPKLPLNKRVKARPAEDVVDEYDDYESDDSTPSVLVTGDDNVGGEILSSGDEEDEEDEEANAQERLANVSFGTLAKVQDSLSRKRKRGSNETPQGDDKLDALRARLRELREQKGLPQPPAKKAKDDEDEEQDESDDDSESDDDDQGAPKSRSSKHAPASQTSKRQVTRKRTVVDANAPKFKSRDPRFTAIGGRHDEETLKKNYSFLNDYADTEMGELRAAIKKTKSEDDKEVLKRKLLSMESKKKSREAKEREQEVMRQHRKKEKEAIDQGKNPFYLKRSEQKQLALVEKYNSMKGKDREKLLERRRKKVAGKEKKMMPQARRMVD